MRKSVALGLIVLVVAAAYLPLSIESASAGEDDDVWEVAVEWVEDYGEVGMSDLLWSEEEATAFYTLLGAAGFSKEFNFGDPAYEYDFECSDVYGFDYLERPYGYGIDTVDFAWFSGHGLENQFCFGKNYDLDGKHKHEVHYSEVDWGDLDLEWIVLSSCLVLSWDTDYEKKILLPPGWVEYKSDYGYSATDVFRRWGFPAFKGLHTILGFDTSPYQYKVRGIIQSLPTYFIHYMINEELSMGDAWACATWYWFHDCPHGDEPESHPYPAMLTVYDPDTGYYGWNDHLPGYGDVGSDIDNPTHLAWRRWPT